MIPTADLLQVLAVVAVSSAVVGLLGLGLLRLLRRRSLLVSVSLVALVAVVAVVAGAALAAAQMFLSGHDLRVLLVVVALAGLVGVGTAYALARDVVRGSRALGAAAAALGDGGYRSPAVPLPAELAALDAQLAEMSLRLARARGRERDLEASRRELVAWISHDLRTPLAGVRAMAEALEDGVAQDAETTARYHAGIRREADRLAGMVDDLFELSRISASALQLHLQEVDLRDLVSDAVVTAAALGDTRAVAVTASPGDGPVPVLAGVPELSRVLANLLANAVHCTPAGGRVHVTVQAADGHCLVDVQDGCGGIPEEDLPRLFEVAFRGTAARTPGRDGGAGLGLAIARGLAEAHGGSLSIGNREPGCRARLVLPRPAPVVLTSQDPVTPARSGPPPRVPHR